VGPGNKNYGCLLAVNVAEMTAPKRPKNDPFVSTGALRTDVNAVNRPGQTPHFHWNRNQAISYKKIG
jgi:hypothetical protein